MVKRLSYTCGFLVDGYTALLCVCFGGAAHGLTACYSYESSSPTISWRLEVERPGVLRLAIAGCRCFCLY